MFYQAALTRIQLWWCINLPEKIKTVDRSTIRNQSKYIIVRTICTCEIKVSKGFDVQILMFCRGIFICATKQIHSHVGPVAPVKFLKTFVVALPFDTWICIATIHIYCIYRVYIKAFALNVTHVLLWYVAKSLAYYWRIIKSRHGNWCWHNCDREELNDILCETW